MSIYTLVDRATATGSLPPGKIVRPVPADEAQGLQLQLAGGNLLDPTLQITPPSAQAFQLTVTGTGTVSATAQMVASNDGVHWLTIGAPIAAAAASGNSSAGGLNNSAFSFFGAYITAISGTGAKATVTMSC